jgi:acetyltransferase-like isoleucine patch superfamily enzyme
MKRDFTNESNLNLIFRLVRAIIIRLRGFLYKSFNFFFDKNCSGLCIGIYPKFINSKSVKLGKNVSFGNFARIECFNSSKNSIKLEIGNESSFGDYLHIGVFSNVTIGKGVLGGSNILITDHNHGNNSFSELSNLDLIPRNRVVCSKGKIVIEDNVWIGDNVKILGSLRIGSGSVLAASSVVTKDIPPFTVFIKK